ncbi:MAG: sugar transferase [Melioribacteraceae bacterium]|nr:sugar transferase [Melioribacteraceae bacterium]MCF8354925.1 sugar transferase [Melioribacteraceae bacterium]MCF8392386.1 sugar transferase [Melioribacteraceae bacterium]MCF8417907.1 sugar transferase [Melioribacteraceae bacterium]
MQKYNLVKFLFDKIISLVLIILSLPLVLISAIVLTVELKSFPFLIQKRALTLEKKDFHILKLRTIKNGNIVVNKEDHVEKVFHLPELKDQVPRFARWIRKTGIDEIPQLVNVLIGQMSIVGPRPLMICDLKSLKKFNKELYDRRNEIYLKPGITGLWQVFGNRSKGLENLIVFDLLYQEAHSFKLDLKTFVFSILFFTLGLNSDAILYDVNRDIFSEEDSSISVNRLNFINRIMRIAESENYYNLELPESWWTSTNSIEAEEGKSKSAEVFDINEKRKNNSA